MQGTEYYEGAEHKQCIKDWLGARDAAVKAALDFKLSVTKQLRNRLLEPFMWHTVILSGTEFENFFALRAHGDAEIHICDLAYKMLEQYNNSNPKLLQPGEWHIPFGDKMDDDKLSDLVLKINNNITIDVNGWFEDEMQELKKKIAVARCARISYLNYEGKDDYAADIKLCDRLMGNIPKHLSPAEHVAQALDTDQWEGNFCGFKQYRKFFKEENLNDARVIKK
jgi:hypothetical protein